jgi:hypothetical protein
MTPIEQALALILLDIADRKGNEAYCDIVNQHCTTITQAKRAEKTARDPYDNVIKLLKKV